MKHVRRTVVGFIALTLLVSACGSATSTQPPSSGPSAVASASGLPSAPVGGSPTIPASVAPSVAPSPTASVVPSPSDCAFKAEKGLLPSDRFTDIAVRSTDDADQVIFRFARSSIGSPAGPPRGALSIAPSPYTFAGSGEEIDMTGEQVLLVRFEHMSLSNDVGQETFTGPRELTADGPAFRHAVLFDESEGIIGWYVGYDGPGCVTLDQAGRSLTLTFDHS
jgi:hypothetical protein